MSRHDTFTTSTLDALAKNIRSAAAWGWRFTDPSDPATWRPASLRPARLLEDRAETVYWTCRDRDKSLTNADHCEAVKLYSQSSSGKDHRAPRLLGGRLLYYEPDMTLSEGLAESETPYFDDQDCPPWEAWVGWIAARSTGPDDSAFLIAWVHPHLVDAVQWGINVSTTDCIGWLNERPRPTTDLLRTAGYLS